MSNSSHFKIIIIFAYCLILIGCVGLIMHFILKYNISYTIEFKLFIFLFSLFHILTGIGVILRKRWAYYIFKLYLYLLYFVIPIGTYISIKTFKHINKYCIDDFFKN